MNDNHYVSFTIDDYTTEWRKVRELHGVGRCRGLTDAERPGGLSFFAQKFGTNVALPQGLVFAVRPLELHFVDYSDEAVAPAQPVMAPQVSSVIYQLEGPARGGHGAVSTSLNRRSFGARRSDFPTR